ncbi:MAG TPA: isoprenylcysteine carboxylmethyltransferase family protein [Candidatus Limnocylindrales bacterium]
MEPSLELVARLVVGLTCLSLAMVGVGALAREQRTAANRGRVVERDEGPLGSVNIVGLGGFVVVGLASAISLGGTVRPMADPLDAAVRLVGIGVLWTAGLLAGWGLRTMGRHLSARAQLRSDTVLVTGGPFGMVRHPLYLSILLLWAGAALALLSWLMAGGLFLAIPAFVARARLEDTLLRRRFGRDWEAYAERVPLLLPGGPRQRPGPATGAARRL